MVNKIWDIREGVLEEKPLIHCITNPISIQSCANTILSVGAKPMMAEHPREVCEITGQADALMLNMGNITDARMESMMLSLNKAKVKGIPVLLDVVGIACSGFRRSYARELLKMAVPSVIKGNYSEIMALYDGGYFAPGVDADASLDGEDVTKGAMALADKYQTVILATGARDVVTDGTRMVYVNNGVPVLASVTGTGCMLGALCTAFMTTANPLEAAIAACCYFGICGELSKRKKGNGSFMVNLMDRISTLGREEILEYQNVEEKG